MHAAVSKILSSTSKSIGFVADRLDIHSTVRPSVYHLLATVDKGYLSLGSCRSHIDWEKGSTILSVGPFGCEAKVIKEILLGTFCTNFFYEMYLENGYTQVQSLAYLPMKAISCYQGLFGLSPKLMYDSVKDLKKVFSLTDDEWDYMTTDKKKVLEPGSKEHTHYVRYINRLEIPQKIEDIDPSLYKIETTMWGPCYV